MDIYKLLHLFYWLRCKKSGLEKIKAEKTGNADWELGWGFGYTPKEKVLNIPTVRVLDQQNSLMCQWYAGLVQKEKDEGCELSIEALVSKARQGGLAGDRGLSNLGSSQMVFKDWGALERKSVLDRNPNNYQDFSSVNLAGKDIDASKHKEKTHWRITNKATAFKMLDEGHILEGGLVWRTAYNRGGGRSDYYYIRDNAGYSVGGHAIAIKGYNLTNGEKFIFQNSYSSDWGLDGNGYIDINWYMKYGYGLIVSLDIDFDKEMTAEAIINSNGLNFKGDKKEGICKIIDGYKIFYKNDKAFVSHNGFPYTAKNAFTVVKQEELDKVPESNGILSEENGAHYDLEKNLKPPVNNNFKDNLEIT